MLGDAPRSPRVQILEDHSESDELLHDELSSLSSLGGVAFF